ncbi:hypothetical protein GCM10027020_36410 [Nocardioides salsibiostraticola]
MRLTRSGSTRPLVRLLVGGVMASTVGFAVLPAAADEATPGALTNGDSLFPHMGNGGYDVSNYAIDLEYLTSGSIEATTTITADAPAPLSSFGLDFEGLTVDSITVNDAAATWARDQDESVTKFKLVVTPAEPVSGEFTTVVTYSGTPTAHTDSDGSMEGWNATTDGAVAVNEPVGAMTFFPNNNTPRDKATFDIDLTVPEIVPGVGVSAVSNGVLLSKDSNGDGTRTWKWQQPNQMAPYLTLVAIGNFTEYTSTIPLPGGRSTQEWSYEDPAARATSGQATQRARFADIFAFMEGNYGPYPGAAAGLVVDISSLGYALETQDRSYFEAQIGADTLTHEIVHQWFGDNVSPTDWNDIWLNEGPAEYMTSEYNFAAGRTATTPETKWFNVWNSTGADDDKWKTPPANMPDDTDLFGWQIYTRGAMTLEALRSAVGTEALHAIMLTWQQRFGGGDASTADFIALSEEISGRELSAFFQDWVYDADKPAWPPSFALSESATPAGGTAVAGGDTVTYTLTAASNGKVPLTASEVTVDLSGLDDSAVVTTLPADVTRDGDTLTWSIPETALGASSTMTFDAVVFDQPDDTSLSVVAAPVTLGGVCESCSVTHPVDTGVSPTPKPTISGVVQVGNRLTADPDTDDEGTQVFFQWYRDDEKIAGANGAAYDLVGADYNHRMTVAVGYRKGGADDDIQTSEPTDLVRLGDRTRNPKPVVKGKTRVGKKLRAKAGRHDIGAVVRYQWYANGKKLGKQKDRKIVLVKSFRGKKMSVRVVTLKQGYDKTLRFSKRTSKVR